MKRALVGSLVLHGVLGAALLSIFTRPHREGAVVARTHAISVEVLPAIAPPSPPPVDVQGGGASRTQASTASTKPTARRMASTKQIVAEPQTTRAKQRLSGEASGDDAIDHHPRRADPSGTDATNGHIERDGDGGEGTGTGGHRGAGIGFGDGGRILVADDQLVLPPPAERRVSKARPAKLIYPSRQRDLGADRLFVARVTVDRDGYVVGAKLVHGVSGPRDDEAADLIFRFRYLPALDDDGRAIRSTFEQPFHVNR